MAHNGLMPELPEVQALADLLNEQARGKRIESISVASIGVLKTYDPPITALQGRVIEHVNRRGKFLLLATSEPAGQGAHDGDQRVGAASQDCQQPLLLAVHLARAGWLRWKGAPEPAPAADTSSQAQQTAAKQAASKPVRPGKGPLALRVMFADGASIDLTEAGTQKRLAVYVVRDPQLVPGIATLGPEPLDPQFGVAELAAILAANRGQIKQVLRDQKLLAGVGNAYSDDILHAAHISPFALSTSLKPEQIQAIYTALRDLLTDAIERSRGLAATDLKREKKTGMRVHGRTGQPCPECGDTVREVSFSTRSLQYCPTCQTGGKILADRRLSRLGITT